MRSKLPRLRKLLGKLSVLGLVVSALGALSASMIAVTPLRLSACFDELGGLENGDPVYVRGFEVGYVGSIELDADYRPCVEILLEHELQLADDTSAMIHSRNLLGDKAIDLQPGGSDELLGDGDEITFTQSAVVLEHLLGKVLTGFGVH